LSLDSDDDQMPEDGNTFDPRNVLLIY